MVVKGEKTLLRVHSHVADSQLPIEICVKSSDKSVAHNRLIRSCEFGADLDVDLVAYSVQIFVSPLKSMGKNLHGICDRVRD